MARNQYPIRTDGYTYPEVRALVEITLQSGISALILGHPGVGKSAMAAELAEAHGIPLIDMRLAQRDPAELAGVYFPDHQQNCLSLYAPDWVMQAVAEPSLVFLDEINAAVTRLHQAAAYQIVLERRVGPFVFHPQTKVLAAGNLAEDNAIVTRLSSALNNRFSHFKLRVDAASWLTWAAEQELDPVFQAYITRFGEDVLYCNEGDDVFPSPRSWAMGAQLYAVAPEHLRQRAVASCVGAVAAKRFFTFQRIFQRVHADKIIRSGKAMDFSSGKSAEPSYIHAAVFSVGAWLQSEPFIAEHELANVVNFLRSPGLDPEYQFLFLRQLKGHPDLLHRLKVLAPYRDMARRMVDLHVGLYQ